MDGRHAIEGIDRRFNDSTVQKDIQLLPFLIVNMRGKPIINVWVQGKEKPMAPEEVSSMVMTTMNVTAVN